MRSCEPLRNCICYTKTNVQRNLIISCLCLYLSACRPSRRRRILMSRWQEAGGCACAMSLVHGFCMQSIEQNWTPPFGFWSSRSVFLGRLRYRADQQALAAGIQQTISSRSSHQGIEQRPGTLEQRPGGLTCGGESRASRHRPNSMRGPPPGIICT